MATQWKQRNPPWNRDETILALDLLLTLAEQEITPAPNLLEVKTLSELLRKLPYHSMASRKEDFRNPNGVALKLFNLRAASGNRLGSGMSNASVTDRQIWAEFSQGTANQKEIAEKVKLSASAIRSAIKAYGADHHEKFAEEDEFYEGRMVTVAHKARERSPALRHKLLTRRKASPRGLKCDVCGLHGLAHPHGDAIFEVHHIVPLSKYADAQKTRIQDVALLCANCHRLTHRLISVEKRWLTPQEVREMLGFEENP